MPGKIINVAAVAEIERDAEGEPKLTWLIEGGEYEAAPDEGRMTVYMADDALTGDDGHGEVTKADAPSDQAPQGAEREAVIAGALFDFLGFLTSHETRWRFSAYDDASPAVQALEEWAAKRSLHLDDADVSGWRAALGTSSTEPGEGQIGMDKLEQHLDEAAVDELARAMKQKLAHARTKGRGGWQHCPPEELSLMLREHVEKGDPRDVANFCAFLWALGVGISLPPVGTDNFDLWVSRGKGLATASPAAEVVALRSFTIGDHVQKIGGSEWSGTIVGTYSTKLTPEGYAVESDAHAGSVQIYPAKALAGTPTQGTQEEDHA